MRIAAINHRNAFFFKSNVLSIGNYRMGAKSGITETEMNVCKIKLKAQRLFLLRKLISTIDLESIRNRTS